jgi:hypothetical protein
MKQGNGIKKQDGLVMALMESRNSRVAFTMIQYDPDTGSPGNNQGTMTLKTHDRCQEIELAIAIEATGSGKDRDFCSFGVT